jgi:hypothetical protein
VIHPPTYNQYRSVSVAAFIISCGAIAMMLIYFAIRHKSIKALETEKQAIIQSRVRETALFKYSILYYVPGLMPKVYQEAKAFVSVHPIPPSFFSRNINVSG